MIFERVVIRVPLLAWLIEPPLREQSRRAGNLTLNPPRYTPSRVCIYVCHPHVSARPLSPTVCKVHARGGTKESGACAVSMTTSGSYHSSTTSIRSWQIIIALSCALNRRAKGVKSTVAQKASWLIAVRVVARDAGPSGLKRESWSCVLQFFESDVGSDITSDSKGNAWIYPRRWERSIVELESFSALSFQLGLDTIICICILQGNSIEGDSILRSRKFPRSC